MRRRDLTAWLMCYGPAVAWVLFALRRYGRTWTVLGLALFVGVGIAGLSAVFIAYFPVTLERLGCERFAAWLRTWWDEDAKPRRR